MLKTIFSCIAIFCLAGCASQHLNYNTTEIGGALDKVYTDETLNNISKFIDNPSAIPSQVILASGTIQTSDSVTPSVTFPLSSQIATTLTSAVTGAASSLTNSNVSTTAGAGAGLSGTFSRTQNYNVAPDNDAISLLNQQALYRHAVLKNTLLERTYTPLRVYVGGYFYYDPFALQYPQCVLCVTDNGKFEFKDGKNPKVKANPDLKGAWVLWDVPPSDDLKDLGHYGNHELFIRKNDYERGVLSRFVLATMNYTSPVETFGGPAQPPVVIEVSPSGVTGPEPAPGKGGGTPAHTRLTLPSGSGSPASNLRVAPTQNFNVIVPQGVIPLQ